MFGSEPGPKLLFPALKPLYAFLEPLSWLLVRCAAGVILAVHGWGKITRGIEPSAALLAKLGYSSRRRWSTS